MWAEAATQPHSNVLSQVSMRCDFSDLWKTTNSRVAMWAEAATQPHLWRRSMGRLGASSTCPLCKLLAADSGLRLEEGEEKEEEKEFQWQGMSTCIIHCTTQATTRNVSVLRSPAPGSADAVLHARLPTPVRRRAPLFSVSRRSNRIRPH